MSDVSDEHPARYEGLIKGSVMTLTVTLIDSGEEVGRFSLTRGSPPQVQKCNDVHHSQKSGAHVSPVILFSLANLGDNNNENKSWIRH